jgi:lipopolysaccharide biosynthesis glycosyltransferase
MTPHSEKETGQQVPNVVAHERTSREANRLSEETIVLVAGADEKFALGLAIALSSALRNLDATRKAHAFVFDGGFNPTTRERIHSCLVRARSDAEITFVSPELGRLTSYNHHGYTHAAFLRLLIPEVVPDKYRLVLYLDSDIVVMDDIAKMFSLPDEGKAFWAAPDDGTVSYDYTPDPAVFAGVPKDIEYFNTGVMLIDLARWKARKLSEKAFALLDTSSEQLIVADQDALNVVGFTERSDLPKRWNFQVRGPEALSTLEDPRPPGIVHFIGPKPWEFPRQRIVRGESAERCLYQDCFEGALQTSGWFAPLGFQSYRMRQRASETNLRLRNSSTLAPLRATYRRLKKRIAALQGA